MGSTIHTTYRSESFKAPFVRGWRRESATRAQGSWTDAHPSAALGPGIRAPEPPSDGEGSTAAEATRTSRFRRGPPLVKLPCGYMECARLYGSGESSTEWRPWRRTAVRPRGCLCRAALPREACGGPGGSCGSDVKAARQDVAELRMNLAIGSVSVCLHVACKVYRFVYPPARKEARRCLTEADPLVPAPFQQFSWPGARCHYC